MRAPTSGAVLPSLIPSTAEAVMFMVLLMHARWLVLPAKSILAAL
jgi:hypothetical protein